MDAMISATLDYLRGAADAEATVTLDLEALVSSMVDDRQACGQKVTVEGQVRPLRAQASALRRCIDNLVDNAVRYGDVAHIRLLDAQTGVHRDQRPGPGIPRMSSTRCWRRSTGWKGPATAAPARGPGLSIAHDIARRHQAGCICATAPAVAGGHAELPRSLASCPCGPEPLQPDPPRRSALAYPPITTLVEHGSRRTTGHARRRVARYRVMGSSVSLWRTVPSTSYMRFL